MDCNYEYTSFLKTANLPQSFIEGALALRPLTLETLNFTKNHKKILIQNIILVELGKMSYKKEKYVCKVFVRKMLL
jgi:hypothetical protein